MKKFVIKTISTSALVLMPFFALAETAFWCDAKEKDPTKFEDVPVFKALKVKAITVNGESLAYSQEPQGLLTVSSSDVKSTDYISIVFQDSSGREYTVRRSSDKDLQMYIQGSDLVMSGAKFLGISGQATSEANQFILNCKNAL